MDIFLNEIEKKGLRFIRNSIVHGKSPSFREISKVCDYSSPRSAGLLLDRLEKYGFIKRIGRKVRILKDSDAPQYSIATINVPLVGSVACGTPVLAEENIETYIPVTMALAKGGSKYFLLRASGDSMNLAGIQDKDILLVRQQDIAENGDKVVALIDEEATVKIFERTSQNIILRPKSTNTNHKPIILTDNCKIQGVVISVLPPDLY